MVEDLKEKEEQTISKIEHPIETPRKKKRHRITLDEVRKAQPREVEVYAYDNNGNETDEFMGTILARPTTLKMRRIVKKKLKENYSHLEDEEELRLTESALLAQLVIVDPKITDEALEDGDLRLIAWMTKAATNAFGRRSAIELKK